MSKKLCAIKKGHVLIAQMTCGCRFTAKLTNITTVTKFEVWISLSVRFLKKGAILEKCQYIANELFFSRDWCIVANLIV